jgi:hypothetical protein
MGWSLLSQQRGTAMTENEGRSVGHGPWVWTAYRAYNELLREKIKKKFEAQEGPWMDKLAGLLVDLVNVRWEGGRANQKRETEILEQLDKMLSE